MCECRMNCALQKFTCRCCSGDALFRAKAAAPESLPGASALLLGCCEGALLPSVRQKERLPWALAAQGVSMPKRCKVQTGVGLAARA